MKLADLQRKRTSDLTAARRKVLAELGKLERQALRSVGSFAKAVAALAPALQTSEKAAAAGQSELTAAWSAALKARQRYATAHDESLLSLDDDLGVGEAIEGAFAYVGSDLPTPDDLREQLESQLREAFETLRDVVATNLEVE